MRLIFSICASGCGIHAQTRIIAQQNSKRPHRLQIVHKRGNLAEERKAPAPCRSPTASVSGIGLRAQRRGRRERDAAPHSSSRRRQREREGKCARARARVKLKGTRRRGPAPHSSSPDKLSSHQRQKRPRGSLTVNGSLSFCTMQEIGGVRCRPLISHAEPGKARASLLPAAQRLLPIPTTSKRCDGRDTISCDRRRSTGVEGPRGRDERAQQHACEGGPSGHAHVCPFS